MTTPRRIGSPYQAVCVCGGYGFPISASAARIIRVGKMLQEAGIAFHVLHCGPSPIAINKENSGVSEGISFQYTTSSKRPNNKIARVLLYVWALVGLTLHLVRLWPARRSSAIYLYVMDGPLNLYVGVLCQVLRLPIVQELCEWFGDLPTCSAFNKWLYKKRLLNTATGALVISKAIERRVRERCARANTDLLIHRLPVVVDAERFAGASPLTVSDSGKEVPNFVYCGTWPEDVLFLIRAFAFVRRKGYECKLTIIGQCGERNRALVFDCIRNEGLSAEDVTVAGVVDEGTLQSSYKSAVALLMPLHDDAQ